MPSTNKTDNLKLNLWRAEDKPVRNDFNNDNILIDKAVGEHTKNSTIHLSEAEKSFVAQPHKCIAYVGNGEAQRVISLGGSYSFAAVFADNMPAAVYDSASGKMQSFCAFGYVFSGTGCGLSISATGDSITVKEGNAGSHVSKLNTNGVQYTVILIK